MLRPTDTLEDVLTELLTAPPRALPMSDVATWWAASPLSRGPVDPAAAALRGGFSAACPAYAFAAGYEAALRRLVPSLPDAHLAALCVTEGPGGRPADMTTTLNDRRLVGTKTYVTLGLAARVLLVAARRGVDASGRARIALVRVDVPRTGVHLSARAPLPFVPEIEHAVVTFDTELDSEMVLPGDGYDDYVKPFRTIEDLHVHLSLGAFVLRVARQSRWPQALVEELVGLLAGGVGLARAAPGSPAVHLALAAHLAAFTAFVARAEPRWADAGETDRERWRRDRPLLGIAAKVREARTASAWRALAAMAATP